MIRKLLLAGIGIVAIAGAAFAGQLSQAPMQAGFASPQAAGTENRVYSSTVRPAGFYCRRDCEWCRDDCYGRFRVHCYENWCRQQFVLCMRACWENICRNC